MKQITITIDEDGVYSFDHYDSKDPSGLVELTTALGMLEHAKLIAQFQLHDHLKAIGFGEGLFRESNMSAPSSDADRYAEDVGEALSLAEIEQAADIEESVDEA